MSHRTILQRGFCVMLTCLMAGAIAPTQTLGEDLRLQRPSEPLRLALSEIGNADADDLQTTIKGEGIPADTTSVDENATEEEIKIDAVDEEPADDSVATAIVNYDLSSLPEPVQRMRELIITAAVKGDIEALRPLLGTGGTQTQLSISGYEGDPINFLREISGDGQGQELLAILLDIFNTGFVHVDPGEETEAYIWPYFSAVPIDALDDRQKVELFRIITAGDYEDMKDFGAYIFYRTAIGPQGDWKFFIAGD